MGGVPVSPALSKLSDIDVCDGTPDIVGADGMLGALPPPPPPANPLTVETRAAKLIPLILLIFIVEAVNPEDVTYDVDIYPVVGAIVIELNCAFGTAGPPPVPGTCPLIDDTDKDDIDTPPGPAAANNNVEAESTYFKTPVPCPSPSLLLTYKSPQHNG